jgi:predicted DNA-binding transcriptional regulator YafY
MARQDGISETLRRHWELLRLIPQAPRTIDGGTLERLLGEEGIAVHRRSIQRDLEALATTFTALECDGRKKPYGWSWARHAPVFDLPPMSVTTAVTFELARADLLERLPRATLRALDPYAEQARKVQAGPRARRAARWPAKVRVVPDGVTLLPPNVPERVLEVAYASLVEERRFRARYRARDAARDAALDVNPLGLVARQGTLLLVCTLGEDDEVAHLELHRASSAELLPAPSRAPRGFDLDAYLERAGLAPRPGAPVKLRALMSKRAAEQLHASALGIDQELRPYDDDQELLSVTVADTAALRAWLRSLGPEVEVRAPRSLRRELTAQAKATAKRYAAV